MIMSWCKDDMREWSGADGHGIREGSGGRGMRGSGLVQMDVV